MKSTYFTSEKIDSIYPQDVHLHYWNRCRHRVLLFYLLPLLQDSKEKKLICDFGCGVGVVMDFLLSKGLRVIGVEPSTAVKRNDVYKTVDEIPSNLKNDINFLLLCDVLEHLPEPRQCLDLLISKLSHLDYLLITLPARKELWSNYDIFNGHYLRYSHEEVISLVQSVGFEIIDCRYLFKSLYVIALIMKIFRINREIKTDRPRKLLLHNLFSQLLYLESIFFPKYLPGSSVVVLAKKITKN